MKQDKPDYSIEEIDSLGAALRRARKERGLTLSELAPKAGLSVSYLSEVERGVPRIVLETAYRICDSLGCTLEISITMDLEDDK
jgi:transcriptional regulator with XRE-family HTH domain